MKIDMHDGKNLVKFGGKTFLPAEKNLNFSGQTLGQTSEKFSKLCFKFCVVLRKLRSAERRCQRNHAVAGVRSGNRNRVNCRNPAVSVCQAPPLSLRAKYSPINHFVFLLNSSNIWDDLWTTSRKDSTRGALPP